MYDCAAAAPATKLRVSGVGAEQGSCGCRLRVDAAHDVSECGGLFWNALARMGWQPLRLTGWVYVTEGAGPVGTRQGVRAAHLTVLYSLLTNEAC